MPVESVEGETSWEVNGCDVKVSSRSDAHFWVLSGSHHAAIHAILNSARSSCSRNGQRATEIPDLD